MSIDWSTIGINILTSGIVAIVFTGSTNYVLQKKNRRDSILQEKGYELIDKIHAINAKRFEVSTYMLLFHNIPREKLMELWTDYTKKCREFEIEVGKYSIFFNKKTRLKLAEFLEYLKEVEKALDYNINPANSPLMYVVNHSKLNNDICDQIINLIKKKIT
ncbi:hypothetical protein CE489_01550 [Bacillus spizizenii]|uniref:hypothetical protein n=1 Tax=Bacillus spizizenii TaxID=96241 RepID=UPI000B534B89|nr:hypothetical protein [Bacillus spizizenii]OWV38183.1 hypothetical protein CE489_01550 [Bacillus spizizenii]